MNILRDVSKLVCKTDRRALASLLKYAETGLKPQYVCKGHMSLASQTDQNEDLDKLYRMVEVEVRGNDPAVLKSYSWFTTTAAMELGITVGECWTPRKANHERLTLLKSVHIYKKHRVQYEIRTYFRFMQFLRLTGSTANTFLEYIQRNLPEGVAMKVTKVEITAIPSHIKTHSEPQQLELPATVEERNL
ncbi:28S ribosomal protein S10, mitochondrial [Zootermopsis nevadensis]|uniref:Small ribosomal subunit protein uS10m n=1 Tax=Zootermopsis nevadensis TaxID=136037 RepID=A0A067RDB1_ZOONE|nr:28S ribosomal protein S10, mitochondrial [Zootermopsis nevadensis]KDR16763.1 28S ribosomal protein S10, mitochondrial [Zootermopsis nevadensis]